MLRIENTFIYLFISRSAPGTRLPAQGRDFAVLGPRYFRIRPKSIECDCRIMPFAKKRKTMSIPDQLSPESSIPEKFRYGDESDDEEMNLQEIYTVEKVLAIKYTKNKSPEYLLKWKNWPYHTSTWEMQTNISCEQLMTVFFARHKLRLLIANKLNRTELPKLASLPSFYGCQIWEDEMNNILSEHGQAPLYVENWMDNASKPKRFMYITKNQIAPETQKLFRAPEAKFTSCSCSNGCGSSEMCCFETPSYTAQGQLPEGFDRHEHWIVECSDQCACDKNCPGRVIQRGRQIPIVIFRSPDRGWGIRAAAKISANSFVVEYVGEVITIEEAERRPLMYQFEVCFIYYLQ
ncbi:chromo (CHRromatin organization MOdifier) domain-containing protein [Ditylenchus destructor]|uniref:Chromo (CHRromatin organization MOdifier) domain-containing protein n=1 Tax=Ditylenchus destructor TaxID=166010 RepID=A0AAD4MVL9_9BILA|nr:chromo (CHRromatin organization MOdifier) domain-containing protein [Ditylenchus destructor]